MCAALFGIDAGVLDKRVYIGLDRLGVLTARHHADRHHAIEMRIDVPGTGDFERSKAARRAQRPDNLLCDDLGCLAQFASKLKSDRSSQFTKLQVRRSLQRNVLDCEVVLGFEHIAQMRLKPVLQFLIHGSAPLKCLIFKAILTELESPLRLTHPIRQPKMKEAHRRTSLRFRPTRAPKATARQ